jgi:hypothetical protein
MRRIAILLLLPLLLVSRSAYAARISLAGADCGTDPLLGLSFTVNTPAGGVQGTVACPEVAIGAIVDPTGFTPLYGSSITSVGFSITNPEQINSDNPLVVDDGSSIGANTTFESAEGGFLLTGGSVDINCGSSFTYDTAPPCSPRDLTIFIEGFEQGTTFRVTSVNGISVPEPATMSLLLAGLAAGALRRRRSGSA